MSKSMVQKHISSMHGQADIIFSLLLQTISLADCQDVHVSLACQAYRLPGYYEGPTCTACSAMHKLDTHHESRACD